MQQLSSRPDEKLEIIMNKYADMLFRICIVMLSNHADSQDVIQETMISYIRSAPVFRSEEHEKAWLIKVTVNKCRDLLRHRLRHKTVSLESAAGIVQPQSDGHILDSLMSLPEKFRIVLTLYYVEEYSTKEIAKITGKTQSAVKMRLKKGRVLLREIYREEQE
ncbi:MAG: RNA polymerase sigma factor [Oscillospiraceae bacterium]|nr:RNA polymerase sigma factor [Oscillospiraceae bacterium]